MTRLFTNPYDLNVDYQVTTFADRKQWLKNRINGIGASECAAIVGLNPFMTNVELYESKVNRFVDKDIDKTTEMQYGIDAEVPLRRLFELTYPNYYVYYRDNTTIQSKKYLWMMFSPDGLLYDTQKDRYGVYEGKTTALNSKMSELKWNNKIPDNYYTQLLHALLVTNFDFAVLNVEIRKIGQNGIEFTRKIYTLEKEDCLEDLKFLEEKEVEFWQSVQNKEKPALLINI